MITANLEGNFDSWRDKARNFLVDKTAPSDILWVEENNKSLSLFNVHEGSLLHQVEKQNVSVPKDFVELAKVVATANCDHKWNLLYRILYRIKNEDVNLLKIITDDDVFEANALQKAIFRDIHKMHAFVRFKKVEHDGIERYLGWYEPTHFILDLAAPFFVRRFGDKPWSIITPYRSAHWDTENLTFGKGMSAHLFTNKDDFEQLWKSYYSSIFNPARLNLKAMKSQMPVKFWKTLPETETFSKLIPQSHQRVENMREKANPTIQILPQNTLEEVRVQAKDCKACDLHKKGHQTVFGEGPAHARIMIIGEQPGSEEDQSGRPFVGPAGKILNQALKKAGLDRAEIYVTNAVKHFKWTESNGKRLHQSPTFREMGVCKPWLEAEIVNVQPDLIICLGVTAATAVFGRMLRMSDARGKFFPLPHWKSQGIVTWHPSAILRTPDIDDKSQKFEQLIDDLKSAAMFFKERELQNA